LKSGYIWWSFTKVVFFIKNVKKNIFLIYKSCSFVKIVFFIKNVKKNIFLIYKSCSFAKIDFFIKNVEENYFLIYLSCSFAKNIFFIKNIKKNIFLIYMSCSFAKIDFFIKNVKENYFLIYLSCSFAKNFFFIENVIITPCIQIGRKIPSRWPKASSKANQSPHHGFAMTWSLCDYHGGKAAMTSERSSDHPSFARIITLAINHINGTIDIGHGDITFDNFSIPKYLLLLMLNVIVFLY
jgi:hypothetical protein